MDALELMGKLHDSLEESNYKGHDLEQLLVRLLFCLFADDTGIFKERGIFLKLIEGKTRPDGSDVGRMLTDLFEVLNSKEDKRQSTLPDELKQFPYVNGRLFADSLRTPHFDEKMREHLLNACRFDWSSISPSIFGSLFQSVMDSEKRQQDGVHYTSEANILKVIGPLFLDELEAELAKIIARKTKNDKELEKFRAKLAKLKFFDPACGCGNFLVIAYREIRRLELEALRSQFNKQVFKAELSCQVSVKQFYGIEYDEFPARIAEVAMWMMEHIANNEVNEAFETNYVRIPLIDSPNILHGDALETDWVKFFTPSEHNYILGNPPFLGAKKQSNKQRVQVRQIATLGGSGGTLDYVAAWFIKAGQYCQDNKLVKIAFVATNSICQGEQVAQLWPILFDRYQLEISFAHRSFEWESESRGNAKVYVIIVGLAHRDYAFTTKRLFSYLNPKGEAVESRHNALTAYLFDARNITNRHLVVKKQARPINGAKKLMIGSQIIDNGHFTFKEVEYKEFISSEPLAKPYMRPLIGANEHCKGLTRWILTLKDTPNEILTSSKLIKERIDNVYNFRFHSPRPSTRATAKNPHLFALTNIPNSCFLVLPRISTSRREYVPLGWHKPPSIPTDAVIIMMDASLYDFAILTSRIHMVWLDHIGGKFGNSFRYSIDVVYNSFPWPNATEEQKNKIEQFAQAVLDARDPKVMLDNLYDPSTMPQNLRKAHEELDAVVDKLYHEAPFAKGIEGDRDRVEHLFGLYDALISPLDLW